MYSDSSKYHSKDLKKSQSLKSLIRQKNKEISYLQREISIKNVRERKQKKSNDSKMMTLESVLNSQFHSLQSRLSLDSEGS